MPKKLMKGECTEIHTVYQCQMGTKVMGKTSNIYRWHEGLSIRPCWLKLLLNNLTTI